MKTEKEKMISGEPYYAFGEELTNERQFAKDLVYRLNQSHPDMLKERNEIIHTLFGNTGRDVLIEPPFRCDYGYNISVGNKFYCNYNCVILDCAPVTIGDYVFFAPNVSIFTAGHPIHFESRNKDLEYAFPVSIGNNVWIGGNVVINPGVSIGDNTVVGSGSVVTRDIPPDVVAAGNPCRVLRQITEEDKPYYYRKMRF